MCVGVLVAQAQAPATPPAPAPAGTGVELSPEQVTTHLNQVIDWYRRVTALEQSPALAQDLGARERLHQTATVALRLAFDFARAAAAVIASDSAATPAPSSQNSDAQNDGDEAARLERNATRTAERIAALESRIATLDADLAKAPPAQRATLKAQRAQANAALALMKQVQTTLQNVQRFAETSGGTASGGTGLLAEISDLERQVPEARHSASSTASRTSATTQAAAPASSGDTAASKPEAPFNPQSAGLISLLSELYSLNEVRQQFDESVQTSEALSASLDVTRRNLMQPMRGLLRNALGRTPTTTTDLDQLAAAQAELEAATARFKQLSTLLVPLREEDITVDNVRSTLIDMRSDLKGRAGAIVRQLVVRIGFLVASIALIAAVSAVWRRATFRYLHDPRRRRQFLALRRVVIGIALTLVVVMAFVSEVGSLATYIGFLTAGLAVALQNVILAVVAYFFLIGRYGVRVGDRVTLAGVTGRVVDIGLVRIYLTELSGPDLQSTGRMIVLSNAVLFQPAAMFKQIPGADYAWHTVSLTLEAGADLTLAHSRIRKAAEAVYATYRDEIERNFHAAQHRVDFESAAPNVEVQARFTTNGLEFSVRYPVQLEHSAAIDQHMVKALRAALDEAPPLPIAESGAPTLKGSAT
jgi:small-conductance mechanosensitive channel